MARILIVEDNPQVAELAIISLMKAGWQAESVRTLREALEALPGAFDLVVLDLQLPDVSGTRAVAAIHAATPAPIVVWTGANGELLLREMVLAGADDAVKKDGSAESLMQPIRRALQRREAQMTAVPPASPPPAPSGRPSRSTLLATMSGRMAAVRDDIALTAATRSPLQNWLVRLAHFTVGAVCWYADYLLVRLPWWQALMAPATTLGTKILAVVIAGVVFFVGCVAFSPTLTRTGVSFLVQLLPFARKGGPTSVPPVNDQ